MDCRIHKQLVLTTRIAERTESQLEWLAAHELRCESCARFRAEADATADLLRMLAAQPAPEGFSASVMARVQAERHPAHAPWYETLFGVLRAPAPLVSMRQAMAAAALVLMLASAGMWLGHDRLNLPGMPAPTVTVASRAGGQVIQVDKEFVDELIARHQGAAAMQPLSDGDGMRLVSY